MVYRLLYERSYRDQKSRMTPARASMLVMAKRARETCLYCFVRRLYGLCASALDSALIITLSELECGFLFGSILGDLPAQSKQPFQKHLPPPKPLTLVDCLEPLRG